MNSYLVINHNSTQV